jgi:hypothetical protein
MGTDTAYKSENPSQRRTGSCRAAFEVPTLGKTGAKESRIN